MLRSPQILSYAALPYGTYPDWFDATYWNDGVKTHFDLHREIPRATRNCELVVRYLFNHPEALILLALLLALGARVKLDWSPHLNSEMRGTRPSGSSRCCWALPSGVSTASSTRRSATSRWRI